MRLFDAGDSDWFVATVGQGNPFDLRVDQRLLDRDFLVDRHDQTDEPLSEGRGRGSQEEQRDDPACGGRDGQIVAERMPERREATPVRSGVGNVPGHGRYGRLRHSQRRRPQTSVLSLERGASRTRALTRFRARR